MEGSLFEKEGRYFQDYLRATRGTKKHPNKRAMAETHSVMIPKLLLQPFTSC